MEKLKYIPEEARQMYWVHTRGLQVTLPPQATENISRAINNNEEIPKTEVFRLKTIEEDGILKKRYPQPENGSDFMSDVEYSRRDELMKYAEELTTNIVYSWNGINPNKEIAVLLYGSIAKGLTKGTEHAKPSDLDLTVIGDFTDEERKKLQDTIQPVRADIREKILKDCPLATEEDHQDIRYAGALVQHRDKLTKNNYSAALNYIGSCAQTLYDPTGIWERIEQDALEYKSSQIEKPRKPKKGISPIVVFDASKI